MANDERGSKGAQDEGAIQPPASDMGPEHCPNCGCRDFYDLLENGEPVLVCVDCSRRTYASA